MHIKFLKFVLIAAIPSILSLTVVAQTPGGTPSADEMSARVKQLESEVETMRREMAELKALLGKNASAKPVDSPANRLNLTRRRRGHPDLSGRRWLHTFLLARFLHVGSVAVTAEIPSLSASLSSLISYISQTHRLTNK